MKRGPDVSHYQGDEPEYYNQYRVWSGMPKMEDVNRKADFIIIKATEGDDWVDAWLPFFADEAADLGIPFGFYHFFRSNRDPQAQWDWYMECTKDYKPTIKGSIDLESYDGQPWSVVTQKVTRFAEIGCKEFKHLYSNRNYIDYKLTDLSKLKVLVSFWFAWPARTWDLPQSRAPKRWDYGDIPLLQRSWWEPYPGIRGGVDDNIYLGNDYTKWAGLDTTPGYPAILSQQERDAIISLYGKVK